MSEQSALAGRVREYIDDLERVVKRASLLSVKALKSGDDGYWDGVALNLHSFYSGVERIFEDIARTIDGTVPSGPDWHISLLVQMSAEALDRRPPVISREVRYALDEYQGFRHVVHNVYAFNFRPDRLKELVDGLSGCFNSLKQELLVFVQFLESMK
jgi:hypothetical protein